MITLEGLLADLTSGDEPRAEAAAVRLVSFGQAAFSELKNLTSHQDVDIRWWALRAISEFHQPETSTILLNALEDEELEIQTCAALGLRQHPTTEAVPKLIRLLNHSDQLLSRLAGNALCAIGHPATQEIIDMIEDTQTTNQRARVEAVRALAEIQDPDSISTLFKIYQQGSSMMQHWAEEGLNRMGIGMVFFDPN